MRRRKNTQSTSNHVSSGGMPQNHGFLACRTFPTIDFLLRVFLHLSAYLHLVSIDLCVHRENEILTPTFVYLDKFPAVASPVYPSVILDRRYIQNSSQANDSPIRGRCIPGHVSCSSSQKSSELNWGGSGSPLSAFQAKNLPRSIPLSFAEPLTCGMTEVLEVGLLVEHWWIQPRLTPW